MQPSARLGKCLGLCIQSNNRANYCWVSVLLHILIYVYGQMVPRLMLFPNSWHVVSSVFGTQNLGKTTRIAFPMSVRFRQMRDVCHANIKRKFSVIPSSECMCVCMFGP